MANLKIVKRTLADGSVKEYAYARRSGPPAIQKLNPAVPRALRPERPGIVYFIRAGLAIKIGFTDNLPRRFGIIQTNNHEEISLIAAFMASLGLEQRLLWMFRDVRLRGEWHRDDPRIHREIARLTKELKVIKSPQAAKAESMFKGAVEFAESLARSG